MSASQNTSFCVPVYGQAESASDSQVKDHSGSEQDQEVSGELVPVFCPSWRDKSQTALERPKEGSCHNGSLVSSLSHGHVDDKRPGTEHSSPDVRLLLQKLVCRGMCCPALHTEHTFCTYLQEREPDGNSMVGCCEADKQTDVSLYMQVKAIIIMATAHRVKCLAGIQRLQWGLGL